MKKVKGDYLLITHRIYQDQQPKLGGLDRTKEFLLSKGHRVVMIESPITIFGRHLVLEYKSFLSLLRGDQRKVMAEFKIFPRKVPLIWVSEPFFNYFFVRKHCRPRFKKCICADPLSFLSGYFLKKMGFTEEVIFHVTDYSDDRFENRLFSLIYAYLFKFCLKKADLVLVISGRMLARFKKIFPGGNYSYFPNSPIYAKVPRRKISQRNKQSLIILGLSIKGMEYRNVIRAIKKLKPAFPKLEFKVIGSGGAEEEVRNLAKEYHLSDEVKIYGFLPRAKALRLVASSGIGVIIYKDVEPIHYYRDSLKIREYAACGLPIIADKSTFTSKEAEKHGACLRVKNNVEEIAQAVRLLLKDPLTYRKYSQNALKWARTFDKEKLLNQIIKSSID